MVTATYAVYFTTATGEEKQMGVVASCPGAAIEIATGVRPYDVFARSGVTDAGVVGFRDVSAYRVKV